ncbi:MAG: hypothetical protein PHS62_02305 [Patescibacteria group bacterium]|nr:hypothetical protein [Patescibacteria group bacterium]
MFSIKTAIKSGRLVMLILVLTLLVGGCSVPLVKLSQDTKKILTPQEAKTVAEKFLNDTLLPASMKATINGATLEGDVYNINLTVNGQEYTSYMTKDGSKFFETGMDMAKLAQDKAAQQAAQTGAVAGEQAQNTAVPKTDKPKVELFVMTYCPYGLQAEKGILPALAALGNKVDAKIRFVHYFMHGDQEEQETYSQICIREEQAAKYSQYLNCFVIQGDSAKCVAQTGVNQAKLTSCVAGKAKGYYKTDSDLSNNYGVEGSPTLVINGVQSSAGRDAASYLAGICEAFNNAPAECSKKLSGASPSAGFGAGTDSSGAAAGCGQ